jgi:hypothetical protein
MRKTGAFSVTGGSERNSLRSLPAVNAVSDPVIMMQRMALSSFATSSASVTRVYISFKSAFFLSGRLKWISINPFCRET